VYGCPVPYARLLAQQLTTEQPPEVFAEGQLVWVSAVGRFRTHVFGWVAGHRYSCLVDNDQLEWPGPSRPELLTGPDWLTPG